MVRVAINGFGRIGRTAFRIAQDNPEVEVVAINDLVATNVLEHLLNYDTNYPALGGSVQLPSDVYAERDPCQLPWGRQGVDVVIESTGRFATKEEASAHLEAGARGVIISAPAGSDVPTYVIGVNARDMQAGETVISNASCTTNCLAPIAKILHECIGIERGSMTTIHAYTADQVLQDSPHNDLRRARAAAINLIPTSTGAAKAIGQVLPELAGKLDGFAVRVPVSVGSLLDLTFDAGQSTTVGEVNDFLRGAAEGLLSGILDYTERPLVSSDIVGNSHSAIVDGLLTTVIDERLVHVVAWYDNEFGYASRLVEQAVNLGRLLTT